jgi:hypothetical protein
LPETARTHFNDDLARAWTLHAEAESLKPSKPDVAHDLARCAVAFGVGGLDAYLCDAVVDSLARTMKDCRKKGKALPAGYGNLSLPLGPLLKDYPSRQNWALRMSAREYMKKDNLLQVGRLKDLLNPALTKGHKLWVEMIEDYIALDRKRLTGVDKTGFASLQSNKKNEARKEAQGVLLNRIGEVIKRRHDIVHNCDRPKTAPQVLTLPAAKKMLADAESFGKVLDDHLDQHRAH